MRSATTGFFSTFASTKSLMRHRSSQRLKNVAASLYGLGPCDTVKAVGCTSYAPSSRCTAAPPLPHGHGSADILHLRTDKGERRGDEKGPCGFIPLLPRAGRAGLLRPYLPPAPFPFGAGCATA